MGHKKASGNIYLFNQKIMKIRAIRSDKKRMNVSEMQVTC